MLRTLLGSLLLATTVAYGYENPRFVSPNGELCVVVRSFPRIGDFERVSEEEYWRREEAEAWLREEPVPAPVPARGALYRIWPGDYRQLLAEFTFRPGEAYDHILVADDGYFVTWHPVRCGASAELLTIRDPDAAVVRTLRVRDVLTAHDQQWLCRGAASDVRVSLGETLRLTMLVTDGRGDDARARHHTIDIDHRTGAAAAPERDHCPAALLVVPEADDALPRARSDPGVVPVASQSILDRAVVRVLPEYPDVAAKARISGRVGVQVVVGADGKVEAASIVKPLPFGLNEAVRSAIAKWEFAPAPSRESGVLAFRFEILRKDPPR